jgi:hypothetical protein
MDGNILLAIAIAQDLSKYAPPQVSIIIDCMPPARRSGLSVTVTEALQSALASGTTDAGIPPSPDRPTSLILPGPDLHSAGTASDSDDQRFRIQVYNHPWVSPLSPSWSHSILLTHLSTLSRLISSSPHLS